MTTNELAGRTTVCPVQGGPRPSRAVGLRLLGPYEGSGFREERYLVERADRQMVLLTKLLYLIVDHADGRTSTDLLADRVSRAYGQRLDPADLVQLIRLEAADTLVVKLSKMAGLYRGTLCTRMAIEAGVSALGLVPEMPSGPGMIAEAQIAVRIIPHNEKHALLLVVNGPELHTALELGNLFQRTMPASVKCVGGASSHCQHACLVHGKFPDQPSGQSSKRSVARTHAVLCWDSGSSENVAFFLRRQHSPL